MQPLSPRSHRRQCPEISRFTAGKLQNIHGGHGQPGTIDHAADVPVQLDESDPKFASFDLTGFFHIHVAQVAQVGMPEE